MSRNIRCRRQISVDGQRSNEKPGVVGGVCSTCDNLGVVFTYWNGSEYLQNFQLQLLINLAGVFSVSVYIFGFYLLA